MIHGSLLSVFEFHIMQPNASAVDRAKNIIPFFNTRLDGLNEELPEYLAQVAGTDEHLNILEWWQYTRPRWSATAKKIFLLQASSAAAQ